MRKRLFGSRGRVAITLVIMLVTLGATAAVADVSVSGSDGGSNLGVSISTGTVVPGVTFPGDQSSGSGSGPVCQYTGLSTTSNGQVVAFGSSAPGSLYLLACPGWSVGFGGSGLLWVPATASASASTSSDPATVGALAASEIGLPTPTIRLSPEPFAETNLATWMWIDPGVWHSYTATASIDGVSASAVAVPVSVRWSMGDGDTIVCAGPGTPYRQAIPAAEQTTSCSHIYRSSSAGQRSPDGNPNDAAFPVTATITWAVSWSSSVGSGGSLPSLQTQASTRLRVEQVQSVDTVK